MILALDEAIDAGLATGSSLPTNHTFIPIIEQMDCQTRYYDAGMTRGMQL